jgi:hypothetical protein
VKEWFSARENSAPIQEFFGMENIGDDDGELYNKNPPTSVGADGA